MESEKAIKNLKSYVSWYMDSHEIQSPIYEIALFRHPDKELLIKRDGMWVGSGYPDADMDVMGYYYDLDTAVQAMHENWCDIQETIFKAGFILCRFPGLYNCVQKVTRLYFLWDEERQGFFEADEPEIFKNSCY